MLVLPCGSPKPVKVVGGLTGVLNRKHRDTITDLDCADKDRLLTAYNRGVQEWSQAVQRLSDQAGASLGNWVLFLRNVEDARTKTQRAKAAYEKHLGEHGC